MNPDQIQQLFRNNPAAAAAYAAAVAAAGNPYASGVQGMNFPAYLNPAYPGGPSQYVASRPPRPPPEPEPEAVDNALKEDEEVRVT